jgi:alpha-beta hydrolase superfamily lysophospholipase
VQTDLLGTPYERQTIELRPDREGPVTATLVRRSADRPTGIAVLYLHGWVDYFFQTHLADFYAAQGIDFYALDLRKHGRSLAPHQTANYYTSLTDCYEELDEAVRIIRRDDGHTGLILNGHSTGGLLAALWAHDRRADALVDALVLNSAFFDFNEPWVMREVATPVTARLGRARPLTKLPFGLNQVYGMSVHRSAHGSWDYDLAWKPIAGFGIHAGWIGGIRAAHRRVRRGLDIRVPVLSAASTASSRDTKWSEAARSADTVLDVDHIVRRSAGLGRLVTIARIEGGLHDLALSAEPARRQYFDEVQRWLGAYGPQG